MAKTLLIVALVIAVTGLGFYLARKRSQRLRSETDATVTRVEVRQLAPKDNGRFETDVFYRFIVNGTPYEAKSTKQGKRDDAYPVGAAGRVRFNPDVPSEADVVSSN